MNKTYGLRPKLGSPTRHLPFCLIQIQQWNVIQQVYSKETKETSLTPTSVKVSQNSIAVSLITLPCSRRVSPTSPGHSSSSKTSRLEIRKYKNFNIDLSSHGVFILNLEWWSPIKIYLKPTSNHHAELFNCREKVPRLTAHCSR